jgi:hypothetical protein
VQLLVSSNNAQNPQSLDLTSYIDVVPGDGMDPYNPSFSTRVISHSLLKAGGVLALEDLQAKELVFPLKLNAATKPALIQLIAQLNQILTSPGATWSWKDDDVSQPTVFDGISGQFDIAYNYRESQKFWCQGNLRLFSEPLGHAGSPQVYAAASGYGPVLMISPYASSGALSLGASTQAGVQGYGGAPYGASTGVFYPGAPSVAGDAAAQLIVSYTGPLPPGASMFGIVPYAAVSVLPDSLYQPLITTQQVGRTASKVVSNSAAIAGQYLTLGASTSVTRWPQTSTVIGGVDTLTVAPVPPADVLSEPTVAWSGLHRLFAIARASTPAPYLNASLSLNGGPLSTQQPPVSIPAGDWGLYDLGTFSLRGSEYPQAPLNITATVGASAGWPLGASYSPCALDVAGFVKLPDHSTWYLNPQNISPSQYGWPAGLIGANPSQGIASAPYTNTLLLDDTAADQFIYAGASLAGAPSPLGSIPSAAAITQFTRGLVPEPDPKNGIPIIAILGLAQNGVQGGSGVGALGSFQIPGASWTVPLNQAVSAQVALRARTRYILP